MSNFVYGRLICFFLSLAVPGVNQLAYSQSLYVYQDDHTYFFPDGWMPDGDNISVNRNSLQNPFNGTACLEVEFELGKLSQGWAGVYWLTNASWKGPGINIYKVLGVPKETPIKLTFMVRGLEGGERFQFKVGGISEGNDSMKFPATTQWLELTTDWEQIEIALTAQDLSNVVGGFCVVTNRPRNPERGFATMFLDDIKFEVIQ